ncbi:MAG: hypothetical protein IPI49_15455 [Myxococcales bacterium]|jgi:flagellar biosynthesis chaperone FliJ|nr:hypothetical protein [Myxococcales bacterium]
MTINRRAAQALSSARLLLREAAAAEHAASSDHQMRAQEILDAAHDELEQTLEAAPAAMSAARSVDALARVSQHVTERRESVDRAVAGCDAAIQDTDAAATRLRERARQAYVARQLAERAERERAGLEERRDQRTQDEVRRRAVRDSQRR